MTFELILFLILCVLPIFYTINLGLFLYEGEKYLTELGKSKLLNFWLPIISLLFLLSFGLFFDSKLEIVFFPICFYFLAIYNIYVLGKLFRGRVEKIVNKKYILLLGIFIGLDIFFIIYFFSTEYLYTYIFFILLLNVIIFLPLRIKKNNGKII